jgi:glycolate oxidase FAD binding subunit
VNDASKNTIEQVQQAAATKSPLRIVGGNSKSFYGRDTAKLNQAVLDLSAHQGVINYEPSELVISVRAGTLLKEVEAVLAEHNQMLAFEPPAFGDSATIGGTIACNFSGPRRPYAGAARDFVLGTHIINGKGELLHFGGEVMKNVAGYDVSRLQCGAMGTLGVILDVSLKVLPRPETELTLTRETNEATAFEVMNRIAGKPLPLSAAAFDGNMIYMRLSGSEDAVRSAHQQIGGDAYNKGDEFWRRLKEQDLPFFNGDNPLWRLSLPQSTNHTTLRGKFLVDWGGGLRWLSTDENGETIRAVAAKAGGHASCFRGGDRNRVFAPLTSPLHSLHSRLKQAFDPEGVLNKGRMYEDI